MSVLVTAAHGNQGRLLIPKLIAAGVRVRACVRSEASAHMLLDGGVADVVVGDLTEPGVLARALDGVDKVYYVGPALHPGERATGFAAIDAARAAGVKHFVFTADHGFLLLDATKRLRPWGSKRTPQRRYVHVDEPSDATGTVAASFRRPASPVGRARITTRAS